MIWSIVEYVDESRALDANGLVCMDVWSRSFDLLYRKSDQLYHEIAVNCGISENAYWLMYVIYTCGGAAPMRELVERCCSPKQTVASSLRALEGKGYVEISFCEGSRKNKQVSFTETGREFARTQIVPANIAERRAFQTLEPAERAEMLRLVEKYAAAIEQELANMKGRDK